MKKIYQAQHSDPNVIAMNFVESYSRHAQALEESGLIYIDKLMDALRVGTQRTVREVVNDLLDIVPDLSEREAFSLARVKFLGIGLDAEAA